MRRDFGRRDGWTSLRSGTSIEDICTQLGREPSSFLPVAESGTYRALWRFSGRTVFATIGADGLVSNIEIRFVHQGHERELVPDPVSY